MDLRELQQLLGHVSILTTAKYTHLTERTDNNARAVINQLISGFTLDWGKVK